MIMLAIEELKIIISFSTCEMSIHLKPCKHNLGLSRDENTKTQTFSSAPSVLILRKISSEQIKAPI